MSRISKDDKMVQLSKLHDMFKKALEHSDNKVQIAMQMYEMVSEWFISGVSGVNIAEKIVLPWRCCCY